MAWVAVSTEKDITGRGGDDPYFLIVNSWGEWNGGPEGKYDIPTGSFWIDTATAATMLGQNMSFAIGDFDGFSPLPMSDWGFDYLKKPQGMHDNGPSELSGAVEASAASVQTLNRYDVTRPNGGDERDDSDSDDAKGTCKKCNGTGRIEQGDGHGNTCPRCKGKGYTSLWRNQRVLTTKEGIQNEKHFNHLGPLHCFGDVVAA